MSDETLSTLERHWAADEERRQLGGAIHIGLMPRPEKSAAESAQDARLEAARALPDDLFLDDAQVQALRVASRTIIWSLVKQVRVCVMPLFHGLHRRTALER